MAVISSINKWQGYTVGASRPVLYVAGSLSKHRKIIHEVISPAPCGSSKMSMGCISVISCTILNAARIDGIWKPCAGAQRAEPA